MNVVRGRISFGGERRSGVEKVMAALTCRPNDADVPLRLQLANRLLHRPIRKARLLAERGNGRVASPGCVVVVPRQPVGNVLGGVVSPDEPKGFLHLNAHSVGKK